MSNARDINADLPLRQLKDILLKAAEQYDGSPAKRIALEIAVEEVIDAAHGRGAACIAHAGVWP